MTESEIPTVGILLDLAESISPAVILCLRNVLSTPSK